MGNQQVTAKQELCEVRRRASVSTMVTGRYHKLPRRIEDDYIVEDKELGQGHNGSVYLARSIGSGERCAVKPFKLFKISKAQMRELRNEVEVTLAMDHPHVARLRDVYECEQYLQLVTECLEGGELFERLTKLHHFSEADARETTYQILLAINYLHSKGIVHRDIKPENFLYDTKECNHLKLIDFGFSRFTNPSKTMKLGCGTLQYMAPEVLNGSYTAKCDIWSTGVVVFILLMGYMPFTGSNDEVQAAIGKGEYKLKSKRWDALSDNGRSFVQTLLQIDPQIRPSAEQALKLPWMMETSDERMGEASVDIAIVVSLRDYAKASRFRRACMSMMAWSLTNEERMQVRSAFVALDKDKTGTITLLELKQVLETKVGVPGDEVQQIFNAMDANNQDEAVNYSDFLAAMMASRIEMHEDRLHETFRRFDVDNSGFITSDNLREVLGGTLTREEADGLMKEADLSRDGKISWEEFSAYMHSGIHSTEHRAAVEKVIDNEIKRATQVLRASQAQKAAAQAASGQQPVLSPATSGATCGRMHTGTSTRRSYSTTSMTSKLCVLM